MKVVCAGGGPAGLYLSILLKLHDPGHDVTVLERGKADSAAGWGVTFGAPLLDRLADHDITSAKSIRDAAFAWRDQVIHIRGKQVVAIGDGAYNITRHRLVTILAERARQLGIRIEYNREVLSISELPDADLIVAADGMSSRVRRDVDGFFTSEVACRNKYIWLGTDKVFNDFNFLFEHTDSGWIWAHVYGLDTQLSTFVVECPPQTWTGLGFDAMSTDDALRVLEKIFSDHLSGSRLVGDFPDGSEARWLNFRAISNKRWHDGNVVLIGDSAHTTHFSTGMGTTLAIEDAIVLAESLREHADVEQALLAYERRRQADLMPVFAEARCSANWLEGISRYIGRPPQQFALLLYARRSPLIAVLPPVVSYALRRAVERIRFLDHLRDRVAPAVKAIYSQRGTA
jgi:2-polyprenyl-6-methoxyphenol hydroxylase-like FAD-dependent oxidoreductase